MFQRAMAKRRDESGFTLIELLIVIVILGILAAIVVFAVGGITDRGNKSACKSDQKSVEVAQEAYYAKNGSYAADTAALAASPNKFLRTGVVGSSKYSITTDNSGLVSVTNTGGAGSCDAVA